MSETAAPSRRRPRRAGRLPMLHAAIAVALDRLDALEARTVPLPADFADAVRRVHTLARRVLARSAVELVVAAPPAARPLMPGAALVMLLQLQRVLETAP